MKKLLVLVGLLALVLVGVSIARRMRAADQGSDFDMVAAETAPEAAALANSDPQPGD